MHLNIFSKRLKKLRLKRNLTLQEVGNAVNVTRHTIGNLENARKSPSLDLITAIADFFGVSIDYLAGRKIISADEMIDLLGGDDFPDDPEGLVFDEVDEETSIANQEYALELAMLNRPDACSGLRCEPNYPCSETNIWQCEGAANFEKIFEEKWKIAEPLISYCDGLACHPENKRRRCRPWEIWMCRDVISKVVPAGHFWGKFKVILPHSLDGREEIWLDFAIETPEGKRIAIELDGFNHYEKLTLESIKDSILRQNYLASTDWIVLRFPFDQFKNNPQKCQEILQFAIKYDGSEFNKTPVLKASCPNLKCDGEVRRLKTETSGFIWECPKCKKYYAQDAVSPSAPQ